MRYWEKPVKKILWTLNVDNYAPQITALTYPLLRHYAHKIGAEFRVIDKRKFPDWPVTYEKMQIFELARTEAEPADWHIYLDGDTLIHPDTMDFTVHLPEDMVCHHGRDVASNRWHYTREMRRDGRNIGSCNWFTIASNLCVDLWRPLEDMTLEQALDHIFPTVMEQNSTPKITREHLIDDFTLSQNIAKYGLKFTTAIDVMKSLGYPEPAFLWHQYTMPTEEKVARMQQTMMTWGVMKPIKAQAKQTTADPKTLPVIQASSDDGTPLLEIEPARQ